MLIAENAELLTLSATMTFHVRAMADLISEVRARAVGRR
jgi:methanogenic corrinoid protein MtbC1